MPTEPSYEFIPRHLKEEEPEVFELLAKFSEVIDEAVNFGSQVFKWCNESVEGNADREVPMILFFRHVPLQITQYRIWYAEKIRKFYKEISNRRRIISKMD